MAVQQQRFGGAITRGSLYLMLVSTALSLVFLMSEGELKLQIAEYVAATGHSLWAEFKLWQILTSPFLETEFISVIFHGFLLWMFVPTLERWWGMKRFFKFVAITSVVGVVVGTLVAFFVPGIPDGVAVTGLDPFIYGSFIAFGSLFANQEVRFFGAIPLTGRQMTIGISVFMLAFVFIGQRWAHGAANVSAMTVAWVLTNGKWTPKVWLLKRKQKRLRKHLKVVRGEDEGAKKRGKKNRNKGKYLN